MVFLELSAAVVALAGSAAVALAVGVVLPVDFARLVALQLEAVFSS